MELLAYSSVLIVPMVFLLSWFFESSAWPPLADAPWQALAGVGYTAVCSTIVAYGLWYFLLSRYTVSQVTPFSLLTPVFGIAFGQLFFAEALTAQTLIGGALTILGVAVIVLRRPQTLQLGEAT
jgi:O-acetylserine/cysteine efflux transporter